MKVYFLILSMITLLTQNISAQRMILSHHRQKKPAIVYYDDSLLLEAKPDTSANVSFGDFDGDGHLDLVLVKGRHWPIVDRVLLGDGRGGIKKAYNLSDLADRSYAGCVADFNGDGFPDIAISNDDPDRKYVYFNDGKGHFKIGSEFGRPEWSTRNISIADINNDGLPDLILANRGDVGKTSNYICLNKGKGQFDHEGIAFAPYPATTITPADFNKDGFIDLVVPHRDGGQSYVYLGSANFDFSDARRIPFGPPDANIRVAAVADFNGDGLLDIVAIDEFKGASLYFGQKDRTFSKGIALSEPKPKPFALTVADLNRDGKPDIIIGYAGAPSLILFNDGTGCHFQPVSFGDSEGAVYGFAVGDFNEDGIPDIAAARNEGTNIIYFGSRKGKKRK